MLHIMSTLKKRKIYSDIFFENFDIFTYQEYLNAMLLETKDASCDEIKHWRTHLSNLMRARIVTPISEHIYCVTKKLAKFDPYVFFYKKYPETIYALSTALFLHNFNYPNVSRFSIYSYFTTKHVKTLFYENYSYYPVKTNIDPVSLNDVTEVSYKNLRLKVTSIERTLIDLFNSAYIFQKNSELFISLLNLKNLKLVMQFKLLFITLIAISHLETTYSFRGITLP